jgi:hypothetical protein
MIASFFRASLQNILKKIRSSLQEDFLVDAVTELKCVATVAYFAGNLLGIVKTGLVEPDPLKENA